MPGDKETAACTNAIDGASSGKELASPLAPSIRPETELISYRIYRPSLVFYADHPARWVAGGAELRCQLAQMPPTAAVVMVMSDERLASLRANQGPLLERLRIMSPQPGYVALLEGSDGGQVLSHLASSKSRRPECFDRARAPSSSRGRACCCSSERLNAD